MSRAACLCNAVRWETSGPLEWMSHCHCSRCRKKHGTAFGTYVAAPLESVRVEGSEHIVHWESSPGFYRCFCRHCGAVTPGEPVEGKAFLPAGGFLEDPEARPLAHIFTASKAPWYALCDQLPAFAAYPEGLGGPVQPDRPPLDPPGKTRGSCMCGGVAFTIEGEILRARYCHCSRCRRARSAAHAANLAIAAGGLRFTRGAELVARYKLPEAQHFAQAFCRTCGSTLPCVYAERDIAVVPMGALDDDPGVRPDCHIFVGSKAPWFEIADALPQHAEYPP